MRAELPAICKLAESLLSSIEEAASRFPRRHRYTFGGKLREQAMHVAEIAHMAFREPAMRAQHTLELVRAVDRLKLRMQLGCNIKAFASHAQFEALARQAASLGRQVGGWARHQHPKGQNAPAAQPAGQRAQILSTRAASPEAYP